LTCLAKRIRFADKESALRGARCFDDPGSMMKSPWFPIVSFPLACALVFIAEPSAIPYAFHTVLAAATAGSVASAENRNSKVANNSQYTIAFKSLAPNNTDIFLADGDGSHVRPLAPNPALDYNASFSADGQWILFTSHRAGSADIWRVHPDGSGLEQLTDDPGFEDQAALSPDGRSLAFVSSRTGQADIWILDLVTHKTRNLTDHPAGDFRPAWSPDGQWIAFSSDRDRARTCPSTTQPGAGFFVTPQYRDIYIVRANGSELHRITNGTSETAGTPSWSADGTHIAFYTGNVEQVCTGGLILGTGTTQIVSVEIASGKRETLTTGDGLKVCPRWSGRELVYQTKEGFVLPVDVRFTEGFRFPPCRPMATASFFTRRPIREVIVIAPFRTGRVPMPDSLSCASLTLPRLRLRASAWCIYSQISQAKSGVAS
jgi:Tol biopolymer transport system component